MFVNFDPPPCFLKIDEVAYVDKGRNLAVALGERDVKVRKFLNLYFSLLFEMLKLFRQM